MNLRDPTTFARAYAEHAPGAAHAAAGVLASAGRRGEAEDVVNDVFLGLWREPRAFDPERGSLGTYVRMLCRSRAMDLLRQGQAQQRVSDRVRDAERRPVLRDVTADAAELHEARSALLHAMRSLPAPQREAIWLACWGDLTANEIAARSGVPLGTVKGRIRLGVARLRAELETADMAAAGILAMLAQLFP